jgi:hypothetical protein
LPHPVNLLFAVASSRIGTGENPIEYGRGGEGTRVHDILLVIQAFYYYHNCLNYGLMGTMPPEEQQIGK